MHYRCIVHMHNGKSIDALLLIMGKDMETIPYEQVINKYTILPSIYHNTHKYVVIIGPWSTEIAINCIALTISRAMNKVIHKTVV